MVGSRGSWHWMLAAALSVTIALLTGARASGATATACGLPATSPLWVDYGDSTVSFASTLFARPSLVVATSGPGQASTLRAAGASSVFFDLYLNNRIGTPIAPADPSTVASRADRLFQYAASATGCATPLIA